MKSALYNLLKSLGFETCDSCKGSGWEKSESEGPPGPCPTCDGAGVVRKMDGASLMLPHDDFRPEGM